MLNIIFQKYDTLERQFKVEWCKNAKTQRYLPLDFAIEERRIIIELDGKQHFEQIGNWQSPEETQLNDIYKMKCANENEFSVIRILQKDVYYNKYNWLNELTNNIEKITNENIVQNIYMCKNNEYKIYLLNHRHANISKNIFLLPFMLTEDQRPTPKEFA